ncbi:energy-coupling factor transporter transmembrane component T family protein [Thermodesulfobacteriota bacterium]
MTELTAFSYRPGTTLLHRMDVRFKILFLVLISLSSLKATSAALLVLTLVLSAVMLDARFPVRQAIKEIRYFIVLLLMVFVARGLTTPGSSLIQLKFLSFTREGIYGGAMVCWRLTVVVMIGLLFVLSTRTSEIKAAVEWFLIPFPFLKGKQVATMMSLVIRFMPMILYQAKETADAQRARGVENRKNPLYRLNKFTMPLIRRVFEKADKLAVAMEARCYTEERTDPGLFSAPRDWIALFAVICLCIIIFKI